MRNRKLLAVIIVVVIIVIGIVKLLPASHYVFIGNLKKESGPITLTDLAGRNVTFKKLPVEKVVLQSSGSGGAFYTLFALEGKDAYKKIVGIDPGLKKYRYDIWEKFLTIIPELGNIPDIGSIEDGTFSVEKVIALNPDVLICTLSQQKQAEEIVKKLEGSNIKTVFIDYHTETLENHIKSIALLGKILGKEERAKELIDFYKSQVDKVTSCLEKINKPKPKVYVECGMKGPSEYFNTYGNFMWGALIVKCGGINIAEGKVEKWAPINPEYLLEANPDVIIITGSYWPAQPTSLRLGYNASIEKARETLEAFTKRPGWDTLSAVKNHRVYGIYHGLSRDIWDFAAMQFMAKCFYPDEFKDLDPEKSLKEFFERFLPVPYEGVWMLSLW
jgi:iron complex transport system substrate-binding protein